MSASTAPSLLHATLATSYGAAIGTARPAARPTGGRLRGWLARKSHDRLSARARALLAAQTPADRDPGQALSLDCLRGTAEGRLARLRSTAGASVDTVISLGGLADAPDVGELLAEIKRVLRAGGHFLFVEPVSAPAGSRLRRLQRVLGRVWRALAGIANGPRDLWNDLKAARFGQLRFQHTTLATFAGLPVPYISGQAVLSPAARPATTPAPRPARDGAGAIALSWREPAFAFFGN